MESAGFVELLISTPSAILAVLLAGKIPNKIPDKKYNRAINIFLVIAGLLMFLKPR